MDLETMVHEKRKRAATVTLNRPERGNALRPELRDELDLVLDPSGYPGDFVLAKRLRREGLVA